MTPRGPGNPSTRRRLLRAGKGTRERGNRRKKGRSRVPRTSGSPRTVLRGLIDAAAHARLNAYAPYSRFRVGAVVQAADGSSYTGANVENASYPVSLCAERVAIHKAVADGHRRLDTVIVVADGAEPAMPCGACRQVMVEFGVRRVIVATPDGKIRRRTLRQLLAEPFLPERLLGRRKGRR